MKVKSKLSYWKGSFGHDYISRNDRNADELDGFSLEAIGVTRSNLFEKALTHAKPANVLEVGCNIGQNFPLLKRIENHLNILGAEINFEAAHTAQKKHKEIGVVQANGFDLPFQTGAVDLVFTAGVLIHVHPDDLDRIIAEMFRVTKKYIFGIEYHSDHLEHVSYRGSDGLLWKQDFENALKHRLKNTRTVYSDVYEYSETIFKQKGLYLKAYLIEKA